jgi:predicted Zn-dependent protease
MNQIFSRTGNRPVMTQTQIMRLNQQILAMTSATTVAVYATHMARVVVRFANDRILAGDDGDALELTIVTRFGDRIGVVVETNQLSEQLLRTLVARAETLAQQQLGAEEEVRHVRQEQDAYSRVALWHETTVQAMQGATLRETIVPEVIEHVTQRGFRAAGFVGLMARVRAVLTKEGITAFGEETDTEVTVTARTSDGNSSGWAGQATRDWATIDVPALARQAAQFALMSQGAQSIEPGRRTAILGPAAVAQLARYFAVEFDARATDDGQTAFSKTSHGGNKLGQRVFDSRVQMRSDPADPDGGYMSYFGTGYGNPAVTWVESGILKNLAYDPDYAMDKGKSYADCPYSLRMSGGSASIAQMIAQCDEGIYVNRFSNVDLLDKRTAMLTGVTRDGCFLVKRGKIDRPVKNFRFLESPVFILNKLVSLGPPVRAALGYTPSRSGGESRSWPLPPIIVPPLMVRDFNFSSLGDAV